MPGGWDGMVGELIRKVTLFFNFFFFNFVLFFLFILLWKSNNEMAYVKELGQSFSSDRDCIDRVSWEPEFPSTGHVQKILFYRPAEAFAASHQRARFPKHKRTRLPKANSIFSSLFEPCDPFELDRYSRTVQCTQRPRYFARGNTMIHIFYTEWQFYNIIFSD